MKTAASLIVCLMLAGPAPTLAQPATTVVTDWAAIVQETIHNAAAPRSNSIVRTPEQTDIAYFWSENPYVFWNRNLIALANASALTIVQAARFLVMVLTTAADAIIAGFEAQYHVHCLAAAQGYPTS
jgi:hypothetical protein